MKKSLWFPKAPFKAQLLVRSGIRRSTTSSRKRSLSFTRCTTKHPRLSRSRTKSLVPNLLRASRSRIKYPLIEISKRQWRLPDNKKRLRRTRQSRPKKSTCANRRSSKRKRERKSKRRKRRIRRMLRTLSVLRPRNSKRPTRKRSNR